MPERRGPKRFGPKRRCEGKAAGRRAAGHDLISATCFWRCHSSLDSSVFLAKPEILGKLESLGTLARALDWSNTNGETGLFFSTSLF